MRQRTLIVIFTGTVLALALLLNAGCTKKKSDCRWAAETLCSETKRPQGMDFDECVARQIINCGSGK